MTNDTPPKSNFHSLAVSTTFVLLIGAVLSLILVYLDVMQGHFSTFSYGADHREWQKNQKAASIRNSFWLTLAGRTKPTDYSDTLLALDLRHSLIEPAADEESQTRSLVRLANTDPEHPSYFPISAAVAQEIGWPWKGQMPPQSFRRQIELVKAGKVDEILFNPGPEPKADDTKYAPFDPWPKVWATYTRDFILGLWAGSSLMAALLCGLFKRRGWWRLDAGDAPFKIWIALTLAPVMALWVACILAWGAVSLPFIALWGGYTRVCGAIDNWKLASHPHREHILTLDSTIVLLEQEIRKIKAQGYNTREFEQELSRARRVRSQYLHLPENASMLDSVRAIIDNAEALFKALQELGADG